MTAGSVITIYLVCAVMFAAVNMAANVVFPENKVSLVYVEYDFPSPVSLIATALWPATIVFACFVGIFTVIKVFIEWRKKRNIMPVIPVNKS